MALDKLNETAYFKEAYLCKYIGENLENNFNTTSIYTVNIYQIDSSKDKTFQILNDKKINCIFDENIFKKNFEILD